jgi:hypothetical protein
MARTKLHISLAKLNQGIDDWSDADSTLIQYSNRQNFETGKFRKLRKTKQLKELDRDFKKELRDGSTN